MRTERIMTTAGTGVVVAGVVVAGVLRHRARMRRPGWVPSAGTVSEAGRLSVRTLGDGSPVLLLHGLVGSGRYWGGAYDVLADHHRVVVPDLLGFGRSQRPASGYAPDDHATAVFEALDALGIVGPVRVAAHSVGCVVALAMGRMSPGRVRAVVGFGPPLYDDLGAARRGVAGSGPMGRMFALPGPTAEMACRWVCDHRDLAGRLSVALHPSVPPAIAADAVQHSWPSYSQTVERCLLTTEPLAWLRHDGPPVRLLVGDRDPIADRTALERAETSSPRLTTEVRPGNHHLPLTDPSACIRAIRETPA